MLPVVLRKSAGFCVILSRRRGKFGEGYLRYLHAGAQNNGDIALVGYLEGDVEEMPGVDDARCVVDHETDACKRRFAANLNEVVVRAEEFF